jgi:uncharacterized protein (UPF0276 family)
MPPRPGIATMVSDEYRAAVMPLIEEGIVEVLERTLDQEWVGGYGDQPEPPWATALADLYAEDDALYGHGVWLSAFSADWQPRQDRWLAHLAAEVARRPYRHVSEHFGYFSAGPFARFTNLTLPPGAATIDLGIERARRLAEVVGAPIGLENTGVALSPQDATEQGATLAAILAATGGFLLLDVHNIWTQAVNLGLDPRVLVDAYPLERVRELHVAGGIHYRCDVGPPLYLDSHDGPVPRGAFELLAYALPRCPNAEAVFLERRDGAWDWPDAVEDYRANYRELVRIVEAAA